MSRRAFDELDLAVYEAHSLAESEGGATFAEMRAVHDGGLPVQRLSGMARRGLLYHDVSDGDGYSTWRLTAHGIELAEAVRSGTNREHLEAL